MPKGPFQSYSSHIRRNHKKKPNSQFYGTKKGAGIVPRVCVEKGEGASAHRSKTLQMSLLDCRCPTSAPATSHKRGPCRLLPRAEPAAQLLPLSCPSEMAFVIRPHQPPS